MSDAEMLARYPALKKSVEVNRAISESARPAPKTIGRRVFAGLQVSAFILQLLAGVCLLGFGLGLTYVVLKAFVL